MCIGHQANLRKILGANWQTHWSKWIYQKCRKCDCSHCSDCWWFILYPTPTPTVPDSCLCNVWACESMPSSYLGRWRRIDDLSSAVSVIARGMMAVIVYWAVTRWTNIAIHIYVYIYHNARRSEISAITPLDTYTKTRNQYIVGSNEWTWVC